MKRVALLVVGIVALIPALIAPSAQALEGRIDPTFGDRGRVVLRGMAYSRLDAGRNGSTALMNFKRMVLLTPRGKFDRRFSGDGVLPVPAEVGGWSLEPSDVAVDRSGRVLLFGTAYPLHGGVILVAPYFNAVQTSRAAVLRLQPDGQLDSSFGDGGAVVSDFGLPSGFSELEEQGEATTGIAAGVVDSRDRPVMAVGRVDGYSPCNGHSGLAWRPSAIARLTPAGLLDPEFGEGDGLSPEYPELEGLSTLALALTPADQPLLGGSWSNGCPIGASEIRLSERGTPLPGYGVEGRRDFRNRSFSVFTPGAGAILLSGGPLSTKLRRVTPGGMADPSFGTAGVVDMKIPRGIDQSIEPVAVDPQGRVLLVGSYSRSPAGPRKTRAFILVERLLRSGRRDLDFGHRGRITVAIPDAQALRANQVELDRAGRLLVLAEVTRPNLVRTGKVVLMRFLLSD